MLIISIRTTRCCIRADIIYSFKTPVLQHEAEQQQYRQNEVREKPKLAKRLQKRYYLESFLLSILSLFPLLYTSGLNLQKYSATSFHFVRFILRAYDLCRSQTNYFRKASLLIYIWIHSTLLYSEIMCFISFYQQLKLKRCIMYYNNIHNERLLHLKPFSYI